MNTTVKLLVPLSTLAVATAVVVGSGATWTSTTDSTITAIAGTLVQTNSENGATLNVTSLKPGDVRTGSLTVTNTGDLDGKLSLDLTPTAAPFPTDGFANGDVEFTIDAVINGAGSVELYSGDFDGAAAVVEALNAPLLEQNQTAVFTFTVEMIQTAAHFNQGKSATVYLDFVLTQTDGGTSPVTWTDSPDTGEDEGTQGTP